LGPKSPGEVNGILRRSLFLVHTCAPEGFGNNFIQAWLQGKPTVSLYFDPEGIIAREGLGYVSGTFPKLVQDVARLVENQAECKIMGHKARQFAVERFSPEANTRKLEQYLLSIVAP